MKTKKQLTFIILSFLIQFTAQLSAQNWVEVNPSLGGVTGLVKLDETLYTISNLGLFAYSTDDGDTWVINDIRDMATLPNAIFTSLTFFDANHGIIGVRDQQLGNQLLQTNDGGMNWEVLSANYDDNSCSTSFIPFDLYRINDSTAIMGLLQSGTYQITHDRGFNWSCDHPFPGPDWLQVKTFRSESEWLFNSIFGLYKTVDSGESWELLTDKNFAHYQEGDNGEIYGVTWRHEEPNGIPVLYRSEDEFQTYDSIALNQFQGENIDLFVYISDEELYVRKGGKNIYYSNDGGQSFQLIQVLSNEPLRADKIGEDWYLSGRGLWKLEKNPTSTQAPSDEKNNVFPNPTSHSVYIESSDFVSFELIDSNGRLIQSGPIENNQIDISTQVRGLYFLRLKSEDKYLSKKIIKY